MMMMMRPSSSLKRKFLKKWIKGLQRCAFSTKKMSISERKKAIKLSADLAMASSRNGTTCWSRAVIADAYSKYEKHPTTKKVSKGALMVNNKRIMMRSKKIVTMSRGIRRRRRRKCAAVLVKKRTKVLKSLIPGGEFMNDEVCLIEETLDYIISLQAQVDVMRSLANNEFLVPSLPSELASQS